MFEAIVLIVSVFSQLFLGLFVLGRDTKSMRNRLFMGLSFSFSIWAIMTYWSLHPIWIDQLYIIRIVLASAALLSLFIFLMFLVYPDKKVLPKKISYFSIAYTVFVIVLSQTDFIFSGLDESGTPIVNFAIPFFALAAVGFIGGGLGILIFKYAKSSGIVRRQITPTLVGSMLAFSGIIITNFVLVNLFQNTSFLQFGPSLTLLFTGSIAYSIFRHNLFDIKEFVARGAAYLFIIISLSASYAIVYLAVIDRIYVTNKSLSLTINLIFTILAVVSYPKLVYIFNRLSDKLFHRDEYEPQVLIDTLNKTLVVNSNLEALLTKVSLIIQENLRTTYCTFYILPTTSSSNRIIGAHRSEPEITSIDEITELLPQINSKVYSTQGKFKSEVSTRLTKLLADNDFEVMARLVGDIKSKDPGIGLFFIGPKRSGSAFTKQDLRVIEIISNELVIAVENILRYEEIEKFNETLQLKIEEATKELKRSNKKLLDLDEAKDEFVSMASHQLRTPLTSIKGYLSMVLDGDVGEISSQQKEMLGQAFFSSQRMVYLISDLLNVSRLKTGKFAIDRRPIYLPDLVESEIDQLIEGARSKNLKLTFVKPKEFTTLMLDDMKIRQVVMNFVDNALYYTPTDGKITVVLEESDKTVSFSVTDSGIGVPKDEQHKLFAKFYRADNARKARPDGTGLGLFMAKKVIVAQGGSLIFKSVENKGSTFGFCFPKEKLLVEVQK